MLWGSSILIIWFCVIGEFFPEVACQGVSIIIIIIIIIINIIIIIIIS